MISEERPRLWRRRHRLLNLSNVYFICQPFRGKPSMDEWLALLDQVAELQRRDPVDLAVIDTLTTFLPGRNEANAGVVMEAAVAAAALDGARPGVLLAHHPAKGEPLPGRRRAVGGPWRRSPTSTWR